MESHISSLFYSGKYSDITITIGDWSRPLHKIFLCTSPFFEARFDRWSDGSNVLAFELRWSKQSCEAVFATFYQIPLRLDDINLSECLDLASFLLLDELGDKIARHIVENLSFDVIFEALEMEHPIVKFGCRNFLLQNGYDRLRDSLHLIPKEEAVKMATHASFWTPTKSDWFGVLREMIKLYPEEKVVLGRSLNRVFANPGSYRFGFDIGQYTMISDPLFFKTERFYAFLKGNEEYFDLEFQRLNPGFEALTPTFRLIGVKEIRVGEGVRCEHDNSTWIWKKAIHRYEFVDFLSANDTIKVLVLV